MRPSAVLHRCDAGPGAVVGAMWHTTQTSTSAATSQRWCWCWRWPSRGATPRENLQWPCLVCRSAPLSTAQHRLALSAQLPSRIVALARPPCRCQNAARDSRGCAFALRASPTSKRVALVDSRDVHSVGGPRLEISGTSAPPSNALLCFHYPRAYLTTTARPHTAALRCIRYQTLSTPPTHAFNHPIRRRGYRPPRAYTPSAFLFRPDVAVASIVVVLGAPAPLDQSGGVLCPQMGDSSVIDMTAAVGKTETSRDGSTSSIASSPEPEAAEPYTQEHPQQQKRKGGRKPVSFHPPPAGPDCSTWLHSQHVKDSTNKAPQDLRYL
jgi:hypothetical protein